MIKIILLSKGCDFLAIKIFIDQGHNPSGINAGAEGFGLREQDITYNVGKYLEEFLKKDNRFEVKLSRNSPNEILGTSNATSLKARVDAANDWGANYFISIHVNANVNPDINGTEVYVYSEYTQSYYFGEYILDAIVSKLGTKNNGMKVRPSLYVLRKTNMPAVLTENLFMDNKEDVKFLLSEEGKKQIIDLHVQGIKKYIEQL